MSKKRLHDARSYGLGWIAPLPLERAAALAMLDEQHQEPMLFQQHESDHNSYSWGNISGHNVVIASLGPQYGKVSASTTAMSMLSSLPHIKCGLLVGIGAGTPSQHHDVRLGDVVVSKPSGKNSGIVQYDLHKARAGNICELKGFLAPPVKSLLTAVAAIEASHSVEDPQLCTLLEKAAVKHPRWKSTTIYPGTEMDRFFKSSYDHEDPDQDNCNACQATGEIVRFSRSDTAPIVHYGTIGSGDTLVKSAQERDAIVARIGPDCLCLEMEAAGVMDDFPCLVVRGICDYADTHKNDVWQPYAAAVAAAYAKELLCYARVNKVPEIVSSKSTLDEDKKLSEFLHQLYTCPYVERKDRNIRRVPGTCQWFTNHRLFQHWLEQPAGLLWVSADPGCGKSVLTRYIIDEVLPAQTQDRKATICYFFFKDDFQDQKHVSDALSAIVRQILVQNRYLFLEEAVGQAIRDTVKFPGASGPLWTLLIVLAAQHKHEPIICVLDALDECKRQDCLDLVDRICALFRSSKSKCNLKFLLTSRPELHIRDAFYDTKAMLPTIHLSGENQAEVDLISKEIDIVINQRVTRLCALRKLTRDYRTAMLAEIQKTPNRTYLWAHLVLSVLETAIGLTKEAILSAIKTLPRSVEAAYDKILNRSQDKARTRVLLNIIVSAFTPLTVGEMSVMLAIREDHTRKFNLEDAIEPAESFRSTIRDLCSLFVIIVDEEVYLLHQTAREYLLAATGLIDLSKGNQDFKSEHVESFNNPKLSTWKGSISEEHAHYTTAQRCLWYIVNDIALTDSLPQRGNIETIQDLTTNKTRTTAPTILRYCIYWWTSHVNNSGALIDVSIVSMIVACCSNKMFARFQKYLCDSIRLRQVDNRERSAVTALMVASCVPLPAVVQTLLRPESGYHYSGHEKSLALWYNVATNNFESERYSWSNAKDTSIAKLLLEYGADANFHYHSLVPIATFDSCSSNWYEQIFVQGSTPLHLAYYSENMVRNLLAHGANPNATDTEGRTSLHCFVKHARTVASASMEVLIESGARPEIRDSYGMLPLQIILLTTHEACSFQSSRKLFDLLHRREMNIDERYGGTTLLCDLIKANCRFCVEAALEHGADTSIQDFRSHNALDQAIVGASTLMTKLLISHGASPSDMTLLLAVARGFDASHLDLLLKAGANVNSTDYNGETALMRVVEAKDRSTKIELFIRYGALIDGKDFKGRTALYRAVQASSMDDTRILLANGANVNALDKYGRTPLMVSLAICYTTALPFFELLHTLPKLVSILLAAGADIDVVDGYGDSFQMQCELLLKRDLELGSKLLELLKDQKARSYASNL